ncbi:MAG TPA: hypothetical protein VH325_12030 [Bryobacteraceae bacterium]|jgi:hypothetical protein|nr:hypothetical protein [Bryobacteraceae bacterium]
MKLYLLIFLSLAGCLCAAKTYIYIGVWPHNILVVDESNYQVVKSIELSTDAPENLVVTSDHKKLIAWTLKESGIEIVDLEKGEVVESWKLGGTNLQMLPAGLAVDPTGNLLYANVISSKRLTDRWDTSISKICVIDLKQHKIVKESEWDPSFGDQDIFGEFHVSPDGKYLYDFSSKITIFDTSTLKKAESIELAKPAFNDLEHLRFSPQSDPNQDGNSLSGIYETEDPIVHRKTYGLATFHLNERKFDFTPIGPVFPGIATGSAFGVSSLRVTPDHQKAYAMALAGEHGDRRCEFWTIDVGRRKLAQRQDFDCRTGAYYGFNLSSTGDRVVLLSGNDLEIFNPIDMKLEKGVSLDGSITAPMVTVIEP